MLSHVFTAVTDFDRAYQFYSGLMVILGHEQRFHDPGRPWAGWHSAGGERPLFVICRPFNGEPHDAGNGQMVAFMAGSRQAVCDAFDFAIANGGSEEGAPGPRPHYHEHYFGAYFRDPDGNKLCVVCHEPVEE